MKERNSVLTVLVSLGCLAFLYVPLLCVAMFSVNSSRLGLTWGGFTLDWYEKLFHDTFIMRAAINTLVLAVVSTAISTVLGTAAAIGLYRYPWSSKMKRALDTVMHLPVVTPDVVFAVALVIAFGALRALCGLFDLGLSTMIVGHVTFQIAFVALVVFSRLELIGYDVEEAAFDLYANYSRMLCKVLLPMLTPGIAAGAMLAFTLSLDDFVISFFTAGPKSVTLPIFIYASVRRGVTPEIHALSTLVMVCTVVAMLVMQRLLARNEKENMIFK
jgi:spermidine/putrescine transport system permease protein